MNRIILAAMAGVCFLVAVAKADTNATYSASVNAAIPDGSPIGLVSSISVAGLPSGAITGVQVSLDITGGFNGDLYAYLAGPNGGFSVLLNRVGLSAGNPFGYSNSGFNITLADGYSNIHSYQSGAYTISGGGQLTGTWSPDGRNIDPQSLGSAFDAASTAAGLGAAFNGATPNGQWTLFVADLSGGGTSQLVSWGLTIAVPEPQTWALAISGSVMLLAMRRRR